MKIRKPDYYDRFRCIAGDCSDSCCIGWEIDVDKEKQELYKHVSGELGERLHSCIDWEKGHFILQGKEERCPFLNQENLCDLIIGLGEESLCDICREHPRYYEWYDGLTEVGIGLCCEEAARLVLESEAPARFVVEEQKNNNLEEKNLELNAGDVDSGQDPESEVVEVLLKARETAFAILQDRSRSLDERFRQYRIYIEELQEALDFGSLDEIEESAAFYLNNRDQELNDGAMEDNLDYNDMIRICRELEAIDGSWPETLDHLEELLNNPSSLKQSESLLEQSYSDRDNEYEHLAVYITYRYFMKCRSDGDIYSRGMLAHFFVNVVHLLDLLTITKKGVLSKEDRVQNAKNCSKEIEYSEENLEKLAAMFWERESNG